jgi:hypothetical protein
VSIQEKDVLVGVPKVRVACGCSTHTYTRMYRRVRILGIFYLTYPEFDPARVHHVLFASLYLTADHEVKIIPFLSHCHCHSSPLSRLNVNNVKAIVTPISLKNKCVKWYTIQTLLWPFPMLPVEDT